MELLLVPGDTLALTVSSRNSKDNANEGAGVRLSRRILIFSRNRPVWRFGVEFGQLVNNNSRFFATTRGHHLTVRVGYVFATNGNSLGEISLPERLDGETVLVYVLLLVLLWPRVTEQIHQFVDFR